jgi:TolB-like protein
LDQDGAKSGPEASEGSPTRLALPDKPSIAVLPFDNLGGDREQEYFADGIVEEIITGLSRIKWLFVISRNSTFIYKAGLSTLKPSAGNWECVTCLKAAYAGPATMCA